MSLDVYDPDVCDSADAISLPADVVAALDSNPKTMVDLFEVTAPSPVGAHRICNANVDIEYDGNTFVGSGVLSGFTPSDSADDFGAPDSVVRVVIVDPSRRWAQLLGRPIVYGAAVKIMTVIRTATRWYPLDTWSGTVSEIDEEQDSGHLEIECRNVFSRSELEANWATHGHQVALSRRFHPQRRDDNSLIQSGEILDFVLR